MAGKHRRPPTIRHEFPSRARGVTIGTFHFTRRFLAIHLTVFTIIILTITIFIFPIVFLGAYGSGVFNNLTRIDDDLRDSLRERGLIPKVDQKNLDMNCATPASGCFHEPAKL